MKVKINKRISIIFLIVLILLISGWMIWSKTASTTRIALLNFQQFQTTSIVKSNTDKFIQFDEIALEELHKLSKYDFVLGFGMGMGISSEQRDQLLEAADEGTPILIYAATNPENNICNLDSLDKARINAYMGNANRRNYQSMARYIRKEIDKKHFFIHEPDTMVKMATNVLFHIDDNYAFTSVSAYEEYLKDKNYYIEGGARIAIIGGLNDPFSGNKQNADSMIVSFQRAGMNVYPVYSMMNRLSFLKEIRPDAVVYFAHGRMEMGKPDLAVEWLKEQNIPVFAPLSLLQTAEEWMADPMGMFGGFMSQSVVVPELDGAIYPYVVNAQEIDKDGLYLFKAIPDRLKSFTAIVNNFISLKRKKNAEKKLAIYYFKGPGQESLTAQGLETVPSLYNLLKRLKAEGYKVENLPENEKAFEQLLMTQGAVLNTYAEGAFDHYLKTGKPALIEKSTYESWIDQSLPKGLYADVIRNYGEAPGKHMSVTKEGKSYLAVARIELGNIALLPQPMAGLGEDAFTIVHGAKSAPPHTYIGAYLWSQFDFKADAMLHFGTHGSLEFTPQKQVALSSYDWPDRLVGNIPHFYYYTIGNIGESMMAKRRSYTTIISYLTPPYMESNTRTQFKSLQERIRDYHKATENAQPNLSLPVKKIAVEMGLHRELRLDSNLTIPYTTAEIERLENFAEEIANEKMMGQLYTLGIPYETERIHSSVMAMSADPIAYSLATLDKQRGKISESELKNKPFFTQKYLEPSKAFVIQVLKTGKTDHDLLRSFAGITEKDLSEAQKILTAPRREMGMGNGTSMPGSGPSISGKAKNKKSGGGHPAWIPKIGKKPDAAKEEKAETNRPAKNGSTFADAAAARAATVTTPTEYTKEQREWARAISELERSVANIINYRNALLQSPEEEFKALLNALNGGYIIPGSGGDPIANPQAVPTGRNLYAVNAEATPSEVAWEKGMTLVNATLEQYKKQHGEYPRKVSYTFWSSEFIETEGATIAQVLYMMGVEPVRDAFGRVSDLQLISSETLGRPRIDVVVQTSGQFRDLAASRLSLIARAVEMAANATGDKYDNYVSSGTVEVERQLVGQGISPKEARDMSTQRIFGGVNGMYGTGIQEMVKSGDKWEDQKELADTYIHNVGAIYGNDNNWGEYHEGLLRAVLHHTDVVVQPRQSNTWGALSLDHVFEFMGGLNLAVRDVTGKDPEAYFADYRNRNNVRMQELKEAIGVESRTTIFNPAYIKEVMKGKGSSASQITEVVTNTYGWNVMKPDVIDNEMWDEIYNVYVKDSHNLGVQHFFKQQNPAALQEITAVMMETARKGMWKATDQQLTDIAELHTALVQEFGASGSGFSGNNAKLQQFIAQNVSQQTATAYQEQIDKMKNVPSTSVSENGVVLKKDELSSSEDNKTTRLNGVLIAAIILVVFVTLVVVIRRRRRNQ